MLEKQIADKIKLLRTKKGYTLDQLGRRACLSKGLLSRIGNCQVSPPIATLSKISHALEVPIGTFFDAEKTSKEDGYAVTLKNKRRQVNRRGVPAELNYYSLSGLTSDKLIEPFIITYSVAQKKTTKRMIIPVKNFCWC